MAKAREVRNVDRVVIRDGDAIAVLLTRLGAHEALLAWADRIVCSPDSVNMVSEACATRAPVFVFDPDRVRGRPRKFLDALRVRGRIRVMDGRMEAFEAEPLRETARVAAEVRTRLSL